MKTLKVPLRYLPTQLTRRDKAVQLKMLLRSRALYKKNKYYARGTVTSYNHKKSSHLTDARKIYGVATVTPGAELSMKTGCSLSALRQIVRKGEGAYYSSGSRPNQTAQSWGLARLASALTAGKAAAVDYAILERGCDHKKRAFILANKSRKKYGHGRGRARKA
jgi:hypothetical protein